MACSEVMQGMDALPACYQEAISQIEAGREKLPLGAMLSLLTHLQSGDEAQCRQTLKEFRENADPTAADYVLRILRRWTDENNLLMATDDSARVPSWDRVDQLIGRICARAQTGSRRSGTALIASVNRFMNECFSLPDLSLKYLAVQFDTSVGALSRLYKQETGRNFSTVLLELRITHAKAMLVQTDRNLAGIASDCGYENYLSFKRAFSRSEGISPREYREAHTPSS
jgi:YesN/AraC family two-component response regulator